MTNPHYSNGQFSQPAAGGDQLKLADYNGELMLFYPIQERLNIQTVHGTGDALSARVIILSGADYGRVYEDALLWGRAIIPALRPNIGTGMPVLGRLGQSSAAAGKNPAWIIQPFTEQDEQIARNYINSQPAPFTAPAQQQAAPTQQQAPVQQQPPAPQQQAQQSPFEPGLTQDQLNLIQALANSGADMDTIVRALGNGVTADQVALTGLVSF